jgi:GNAT superfamily N-acetyltransferase
LIIQSYLRVALAFDAGRCAEIKMNKNIIIREALPADSDHVFLMAKTMATSFDVDAVNFKNSYADILKNSDSICFIAESNNKPIGYLLGFDHPAFYANGRVSWMEEIYVVDDYRKKGIGRMLTDEFEQWCAERKSKLIGLATRRAADFYKSMDYEESAIFFRKLL